MDARKRRTLVANCHAPRGRRSKRRGGPAHALVLRALERSEAFKTSSRKMYSIVTNLIRTSLRSLVLVLCIVPTATHGDSLSLVTPPVSMSSPVIVIGFVGGFVRHDANIHSTVQVAAHLRQDHPLGVYAEVLENRRGKKAHTEIVQR